MAVGVVAERDDVGAGLEQLVGMLRRDPDAAGGVLPVHDHEVGAELRAEVAEHAADHTPAGGPDDIADEEDRGQDVDASAPPAARAYLRAMEERERDISAGE